MQYKIICSFDEVYAAYLSGDFLEECKTLMMDWSNFCENKKRYKINTTAL